MIFNVGSRRSGTFWLQRIVGAHPDVASVPSETHLFSHGIAPLFERFQHGSPSSPEVGAVYVEREALITATRALCDTALEPFRQGHPALAERTPLHVHHLELIAELYPEAGFVHIVRDGRDVARSLTRQDWGPESVAAAAEEWAGAVRAGRAGGAAVPVYHELRYEELLTTPRPVIERLYAALGLRLDEGAIESALREAAREENVGKSARGGVGAGKWRDEWTADDLAAFDAVAGELLQELGYEAEAPEPGSVQMRPRRPAPPPGGPPAAFDPSGTNAVIAAVSSGRAQEVLALASPDLRLWLGCGRERRTVEGEAVGTELERVLGGDAAFGSRQLAADTHPGFPWAGTTLVYEVDSEPVRRTIFTHVRAGRLRELSLPDAVSAADGIGARGRDHM